MRESVRSWAPLEWGGIASTEREMLDRVVIERDAEDILVSDAATGRELLRVAPDDLRQRSLVPMLLVRLGDFYCTGCGTLLVGSPVPTCSGCDKDRARRLRNIEAMLAEEDA